MRKYFSQIIPFTFSLSNEAMLAINHVCVCVCLCVIMFVCFLEIGKAVKTEQGQVACLSNYFYYCVGGMFPQLPRLRCKRPLSAESSINATIGTFSATKKDDMVLKQT